MAPKLFILFCVITFLQTITAQVIGRAINNGLYRNPISTLAIENPYGPNIAYPANTLAYESIANGFYGPANPLAYDTIGNGIYNTASPLAYDGIVNNIYGPINSLAYDGIVNGIYGPANPLAYDGIINNIYSPANSLAYDEIVSGIYGPANPLAYDGIPNSIYGPTLACNNKGYGLSLATLSSNGGSFSVKSSSPMSVKGISVESENMVIEGPLLVNGKLPFLGTIGLEGAMPVAGNGAVLYSCGNGNVGILEEEYSSLAVPSVGYGCNGMPTSGYGPVAGSLGINRLPYVGLY